MADLTACVGENQFRGLGFKAQGLEFGPLLNYQAPAGHSGHAGCLPQDAAQRGSSG